MVRLDALASLALAVRNNSLALGTYDKRESLCCLESCVDSIESDCIVAVADKDGNTATSNSRLCCIISSHTDIGLLAGVGLAMAGWTRGPSLFGYAFGELNVDMTKTLDDKVVNNGIVAVV